MHTVNCPHCGRKIKLGKAVAKASLQCRYCMKMFIGTSQETQDERAPSFTAPPGANQENAPAAESGDILAEDTASSKSQASLIEENEPVEDQSSDNNQAENEDMLMQFADEKEESAPAPAQPAKPAPKASAGQAPPKVSGGSAPPKVSAGSAPPKVIAGKAPAKVSAGQAPPKVSAGSAPPKVSAGKAPAKVTPGKAPARPAAGGKAPPPVAKGSKPAAPQQEAADDDPFAALADASKGPTSNVVDQGEEDPFAALADQTDDGKMSASKTTSRPPAQFAAEMMARKAPKPVGKAPAPVGKAPAPVGKAPKPLPKSAPKAAPPPVEEEPQQEAQAEEDPFAALTGAQEEPEQVQDLVEDVKSDIPAADETDQETTGETYNIQEDEVADEQKPAEEDDPFAALGEAAGDDPAPAKPAKSAKGKPAAKASTKQKKGSARQTEGEDGEQKKYVRKKKSLLIPMIIGGGLVVCIITAVVIMVVTLGNQSKAKEEKEEQQQAQNSSSSGGSSSGGSSSSQPAPKPPPTLPPLKEPPKAAQDAPSLAQVDSGSFFPANEGGLFNGLVTNISDSPLLSVTLNMDVNGLRLNPVTIEYIPPKMQVPYCFSLPESVKQGDVSKDKVVITNVIKAPPEMTIWKVDDVKMEKGSGKVSLSGSIKSPGGNLSSVQVRCDLYTDKGQPAGGVTGDIDGGGSLKAGDEKPYKVDVTTELDPDVIEKKVVRAFGNKSS